MEDYLNFWKSENARLEKKIINIYDLKLTINPGVFNPDPDLTYSSSIILENFPNVEGKKILDIGTGSGILLINSLNDGAKVGLGTDIDIKALECARMNLQINRVDNRSVLVWSDIFSSVYDKFDIMFANLPIIEKCSAFKIKQLLYFYKKHLNKNGLLYLTYASFGSISNPINYFNKNYDLVRYHTKKAFGVQWYLFIFEK